MKKSDSPRESRFFHGFPDEIREEITEAGEERFLPAGEELFREGDPADSLWIVLEGTLEALAKAGSAAEGADERVSELRLGLLEPGDPIGEIAVLLGGRRTATVRAVEHSRLARFTREHILGVAESSPELHGALEAVMQHRLERNRVLEAVHGFFGEIDPDETEFIADQLERRSVERGEYLFRFGDPGDELYIVIHGSFEVLVPDTDGRESLVAHVRRGEPIGEMALLADDARGASIRAARRSEVVVFSREVFERVSLRFPKTVLGITRVLVHRFRRLSGTQHTERSMGRSIVLLPGGTGAVELETFAHRLVTLMPSGIRTAVVSNAIVARELGNQAIAFTEPGNPRASALEAWLEEYETRFEIVFYLDSTSPVDSASPGRPNAWIRRCMSRADEVMICAGIDSDPEIGPIERAVYQEAHTDAPVQRRLVLFHDTASTVSRRGFQWLRHRPHTTLLHIRTRNDSDIARLARDISGRSVGLALGGGGARGIAHVGVLRALHETGVPVDKLAGTSMGAVVGALHGAGFDTRQMLEQIEAMFVKVNPFHEYTLPVYSLLRGRKSALASIRTFRNLRIEDLWIPFVCTSTNVTRQQLVTHRSGGLAKAILASTALPGVTVPIVYDGEIHVDGGVINNLPGDLLRDECLRLITSDVNPVHHFGPAPNRFPSPWKKLIPHWASGPAGGNRRQAPPIGNLLFASMNSGSQQAAAGVRRSADLSLTPPTGEIGLLDFKRLHQIAELGYDHAMRRLESAAVGHWAEGLIH